MSRTVSQYYPDKDLTDDVASMIIAVPTTANSVSQHIFVAPFNGRVVSVREIHSVVGSTSAAVKLRRITDTSAPAASASTTVLELQSAAFDLTATINTSVDATLAGQTVPVNTSANYFNSGDRLALAFSGTLTGLVGLVQLHIKRT